MELQNLRPRELHRQSARSVGGPLLERYQSLQALDGSPEDREPRDGYLSVERPDGTLQAVLGTSYNGVEYTARVMRDGQLVRGENASVSNDATQVLAGHYEAEGQLARACEPSHFQDITREFEALATLERGSSQLLDSPVVRQWTTVRGVDAPNQSVLSELRGEEARTEDYYYLHNFELLWNPQ